MIVLDLRPRPRTPRRRESLARPSFRRSWERSTDPRWMLELLGRLGSTGDRLDLLEAAVDCLRGFGHVVGRGHHGNFDASLYADVADRFVEQPAAERLEHEVRAIQSALALVVTYASEQQRSAMCQLIRERCLGGMPPPSPLAPTRSWRDANGVLCLDGSGLYDEEGAR